MTDQEFEELFERYMDKKRNRMKEQYNRVLPSGELIFNRFEKAPYLNCGTGSSIYDTSVVLGDVEIGDHVWVGPYTLLDGANAKLTIGNYVSIDTGVLIYTHDSTKNYLSGGAEPFSYGNVIIKDYTVIGSMTVIACGVSIGSHCVVGAHSFVNSDIPDHCIAAGVPAKIIGEVVIDASGKVAFSYY